MNSPKAKLLRIRKVAGRILAFPFVLIYQLLIFIAKVLYLLLRLSLQLFVAPFRLLFHLTIKIGHQIKMFFTDPSGDQTPEDSLSLNSKLILKEFNTLRRHLIRCAIAFAGGCVLSSFYVGNIILFLEKPLEPFLSAPIDILNPGDAFYTTLNVIFSVGLLLPMPYLVFEMFLFTAPGLRPRERRLLFGFMPLSFVIALMGLSYGYFLALPQLLEFIDLSTRMYGNFSWDLSTYISFAIKTLFFHTLFFFMPLFSYTLGIINIRPPKVSARILFVISFVLSAELTPGTLVIGDLILSVILMLLYYLCIGLMLIALTGRRKANKADILLTEK